MTCARAERLLSAWIDGELSPPGAGALSAHLAACPGCSRRAEELREVGRLLAELPRLEPPEPVAGRVRDRLEMETRSPALAFLFRGFVAARPLIGPSLVPAALVLVTVLAAAVALDSVGREPLARGNGTWLAAAPSGTEANPLFPSEGVALPRARRDGGLPAEVLNTPGEGTLFLETVVARDGTVAGVTVLDGNAEGALVAALLRQRYEPVRFRGRPVAVSIYRLISRMEVLAPRT